MPVVSGDVIRLLSHFRVIFSDHGLLDSSNTRDPLTLMASVGQPYYVT